MWAYSNRIEQVRQKIIEASIYPALLILVGSGVLLFPLGYVVPGFSTVFCDVGRDLPWLSRILLTLGTFIHDHAVSLAAAAAMTVIGTLLFIRLPPARQRIEEWIAALPAVRRSGAACLCTE